MATGRSNSNLRGTGKILPKLVRPYGLAIIHACLGQKPKAFENLENALAERDTQITELAIEPQFDALRSDGRFVDLERRIGLLPR